MKRMSVLCKSIFLVVGFMILSGFIPLTYGQDLGEGGGGQCKVTVACVTYELFWCSCPDRDCSSCAIPSGGGGCGMCSK